MGFVSVRWAISLSLTSTASSMVRPFSLVDYGGWTMDTSVMLMYAVIKSTMLGFAYTDGGKK